MLSDRTYNASLCPQSGSALRLYPFEPPPPSPQQNPRPVHVCPKHMVPKRSLITGQCLDDGRSLTLRPWTLNLGKACRQSNQAFNEHGLSQPFSQPSICAFVLSTFLESMTQSQRHGETISTQNVISISSFTTYCGGFHSSCERRADLRRQNSGKCLYV